MGVSHYSRRLPGDTDGCYSTHIDIPPLMLYVLGIGIGNMLVFKMNCNMRLCFTTFDLRQFFKHGLAEGRSLAVWSMATNSSHFIRAFIWRKSWGSSISAVSDYRLDKRGSIASRDKDFS
jgi:hypothetical protein